jgi:hypothetical protein
MLRVLRAFDTARLEYVLIGATAMGFHGLVRATEDVDLLVRAVPENIERLRTALRESYDGDPHVEDISAEDLLGDYPAVRYYPPRGDLYFDILTRLREGASFENVASEVKESEGICVPVATPAALYRLKRGSVRPIDHQDAAGAARTVRAEGRRIVRVQRFRSVEEMNAARAVASPEEAFERFLRHCARYWTISPRTYPRGVFKFRSLEEAQAARRSTPHV